MTVKRSILAAAFVLVCIAALPSVAWAQSAFAGVVRDTSGAVMPGVTVEAASPALIEKVRSAVTDENGAYRIVDLRPGNYTLTFSLTGFNTQIREGSNWRRTSSPRSTSTSTVGTLQESVTVSGASPVVDVQSNAKQQVLTREVLERRADRRHHPGPRPAGGRRHPQRARRGRLARDAADLLRRARPGRRADRGDGRRPDDQRPDGRRRGAGLPQRGDDAGSRVPDGGRQRRDADRRRQHEPGPQGRRQPVQRRVQGLQVARSRGRATTSPTTSKAIGVTRASTGSRTSTSGTSSRAARSSRTSCGSSARSARRATTGPSPTPSTSRPARRTSPAAFAACQQNPGSCEQGISDEKMDNPIVRLTWQVSERNKFAVYYDRALRLRGHGDGRAHRPDDRVGRCGTRRSSPPGSAKWTSTVSSKLLLENGFSFNRERYDNLYQPGIFAERGHRRLVPERPQERRQHGPPVERLERAAGQLPGPLQRCRRRRRTSPARTTSRSALPYQWGQYHALQQRQRRPLPDLQQRRAFQVTVLNTPARRVQEDLDAKLGLLRPGHVDARSD